MPCCELKTIKSGFGTSRWQRRGAFTLVGVGNGLVASLARQDGNATDFMIIEFGVRRDRWSLLKQDRHEGRC